MVGEEKVVQNFGEIGSVETKGEGWTLLQNTKENKQSSNMISFEDEKLKFSEENAHKLKMHADLLFDIPIKAIPKSTSANLYVEITAENETYFYVESGLSFTHIKGYAGPINVGLLLNSEGTIEKVQHVSSKETESYLAKIVRTGFYSSFIDLPVDEAHEIDAVSGATLTTNAIAKTVTELGCGLGNDFTENFNRDRLISSFEVKAVNSLWWILHVGVIGLMFLYGFQKKYKKSKRDIRILSVVSVVYIGFFMNNSFTYVSFIHPFLGTALSPLIAFYAFFSLLGAIWGSNIYCAYVCPFGHAQRLSLAMSKKKFTTQFPLSNKTIKYVRDGLTLVLIIGLLLGLRSWGNFELFPDLFGLEFNSIWFAISALIIGVNLRYPFIWCRIACPTGAVLDGISKGCK
jgi:NosR/NirI family nitrous oxide reductase transcriptional regulator